MWPKYAFMCLEIMLKKLKLLLAKFIYQEILELLSEELNKKLEEDIS
jgi:hypothetical protein